MTTPDPVLRGLVAGYLKDMSETDRAAFVAEVNGGTAGGDTGASDNGGGSSSGGGDAGGDKTPPGPAKTMAEGADLYARMHPQADQREYGRNK